MNRTELQDQIREALSEVLHQDVAELSDGMRLFEDLSLDSTGVIELLMTLEDRVGLDVDPDSLQPEVFETVASLTDYVVASLAAQPA